MSAFQSPIYGSRTRREDWLKAAEIGFNPLSTGHALSRRWAFPEPVPCFNPLSTGHAHGSLNKRKSTKRGFNPLSTGHAQGYFFFHGLFCRFQSPIYGSRTMQYSH